MKVIGIGDGVCDKYRHTGMMYPGGQALNFSVYARMLGYDSAFMGVLGTDDVASHILSTLDAVGVDRIHCIQRQGESGYAIVDIKNGERAFLYSNKGGVARESSVSFSDDDLRFISGFSLLHTSNNSYLDDKLSVLSATGVPISYDFSTQWTDQARLCNAVHIRYAFLSGADADDEELRRICVRIAGMGCLIVVATRGKRGALLYNGSTFFEQAPKPIEAVDTLGAGDAFAAAFLLSYISSTSKEESRRIREALLSGTEFASRICMIDGAFGYAKPYAV